jgi:hypothetical protein
MRASYQAAETSISAAVFSRSQVRFQLGCQIGALALRQAAGSRDELLERMRLPAASRRRSGLVETSAVEPVQNPPLYGDIAFSCAAGAIVHRQSGALCTI